MFYFHDVVFHGTIIFFSQFNSRSNLKQHIIIKCGNWVNRVVKSYNPPHVIANGTLFSFLYSCVKWHPIWGPISGWTSTILFRSFAIGVPKKPAVPAPGIKTHHDLRFQYSVKKHRCVQLYVAPQGAIQPIFNPALVHHKYCYGLTYIHGHGNLLRQLFAFHPSVRWIKFIICYRITDTYLFLGPEQCPFPLRDKFIILETMLDLTCFRDYRTNTVFPTPQSHGYEFIEIVPCPYWSYYNQNQASPQLVNSQFLDTHIIESFKE